MLYTEGKARIECSKSTFLNPKMAGLRDLSVLFVRALGGDDKSLLDATAATGIRGIRYGLEAGIKRITLIDINKGACRDAKVNLKRNGVKAALVNDSVQGYANRGNGPFDIIDLDPFGSPVPYLYDIMKLCHGDTALMVTATDTAVLCGAHAAACLKQYGARPLHNELCKEAGTRILLGFIARAAAQFNFGISVHLSISNMHYMRVFLSLRKGAKEAVESVKQTGFAASCRECRFFAASKGTVPCLPQRCGECGAEMERAGPMWLGNLYNKSIVSRMLSAKAGITDNLAEQLSLIVKEPDTPFFYSMPAITRALGIGSVSPGLVIRLLKRRGYDAAPTQFLAEGIKTDAKLGAIVRAVKESSRAKAQR
ncbi:MAG: hypothetical protein M1354_02360 [Candidatus Marsarchaeota archaeon]|nr:hypothetical protein [Candidatus Marsarchaeota archaeon]